MPPVLSKSSNQDATTLPGPPQWANVSSFSKGRPIFTDVDTEQLVEKGEVDTSLANLLCHLEPYHRDAAQAWLDSVSQMAEGYGAIFKPGDIPILLKAASTADVVELGERRPVPCDISHGSFCTLVFDCFDINEDQELIARQLPDPSFHRFIKHLMKPSEEIGDISWPVKMGVFSKIIKGERKERLQKVIQTMRYEIRFMLKDIYLLEEEAWSSPLLKRGLVSWVPLEILDQVMTLERNHPDPDVSIVDRMVACSQLNAARDGEEDWIQAGTKAGIRVGYPDENSVSSRTSVSSSSKSSRPKKGKGKNKTSPFKNFEAHGPKKVPEDKPARKEKAKPKPPGIMASMIKKDKEDSPDRGNRLAKQLSDLELKTPGPPKHSSTPGKGTDKASPEKTRGGRTKITSPEESGKKGKKKDNWTPSLTGRVNDNLVAEANRQAHGPLLGEQHYTDPSLCDNRAKSHGMAPVSSRKQSPEKRRAKDEHPRPGDSPKRVVSNRELSPELDIVATGDTGLARVTRRLSMENIESEEDFADETFQTARDVSGDGPLMSSTQNAEAIEIVLQPDPEETRPRDRVVRLVSREPSRSKSRSRPPSPVYSNISDTQDEDLEKDPTYSDSSSVIEVDSMDRDPDATRARRIEKKHAKAQLNTKDVSVVGIKVDSSEITPEVAARVIVNTGKPLKESNRSTRSKRKHKKRSLTEEEAMRYQEKVEEWRKRQRGVSSPIVVRKKTKDKKERSVLKELAKISKVQKVRWDNPDEENFSVLFTPKDRRVQVKVLALKIRDLARQRAEAKKRLEQILAHRDDDGYETVDFDDSAMLQVDVLADEEDLSDLEYQVGECFDIMKRLKKGIKADKAELAKKKSKNQAGFVSGIGAGNDEQPIPSAPPLELLSTTQVATILAEVHGLDDDEEPNQGGSGRNALNDNLNAPEADFIPDYSGDEGLDNNQADRA